MLGHLYVLITKLGVVNLPVASQRWPERCHRHAGMCLKEGQ